MKTIYAIILSISFIQPAFAKEDPGMPDAEYLKVCADPYMLPFSNQKEEGYENKIAQLLAKKLGLKLKYEFFPQRGQLFSATVFQKQIMNPINLSQTRGSSGYFIYSNTGEKVNIYGFELEARTALLKNEDDESVLNMTANLTKMWLKQDLLKDFQYKNITESSLQGASDFIANGSISYGDKKEKEFIATLTGNYSSDRIFALGSPEDFANSAALYNDEIIEKGFVTLDLVMSKDVTKNLQVKLVGRNLLNPEIKQTQKVRNLISAIETNETVLSYKKGSQLTVSFKYSF